MAVDQRLKLLKEAYIGGEKSIDRYITSVAYNLSSFVQLSPVATVEICILMCIHVSNSYRQHHIFQFFFLKCALSIPTSSTSHFVNSHFVNFHFVNSHFVNIDQMGIDQVGIDQVGS